MIRVSLGNIPGRVELKLELVTSYVFYFVKILYSLHHPFIYGRCETFLLAKWMTGFQNVPSEEFLFSFTLLSYDFIFWNTLALQPNEHSFLNPRIYLSANTWLMESDFSTVPWQSMNLCLIMPQSQWCFYLKVVTSFLFRECKCFKFLAATSSSIAHSVAWLFSRLVHRNSPLFGSHGFSHRRLRFGMEVKCVCKGLSLCSCQWLKGGVVMGVAYCKKVHNFGFTESYKIYCKGWSRAKGQLINC